MNIAETLTDQTTQLCREGIDALHNFPRYLNGEVHIAGCAVRRTYLQDWCVKGRDDHVGQASPVGAHDERSSSEKL